MLITMSDTELSRLEAIQKIKEKRLKVSMIECGLF